MIPYLNNKLPMRFLCFFAVLFLAAMTAHAQVTGSFTVNGDDNKFYPVTFYDGGWLNNSALELDLGRSDIHISPQRPWTGSIIAKFRFHITNWGNGSEFIDADIKQRVDANTGVPFIGGWKDASGNGPDARIIIWLRGGGMTYYYKSNYAVSPTVYDTQSYKETNGPLHEPLTAAQPYVNGDGLSFQKSAFFTAVSPSFFAGSVGIGTFATSNNKLTVEGTIAARRVKVTQANPWPDYVFQAQYPLRSLDSLEQYIQTYSRLPEMPAASEVAANGQDLGEINTRLLQKIEELTLYIISQNKKINLLEEKINAIAEKVK